MSHPVYAVSHEKAAPGEALIPRKAAHLPPGFQVKTEAAHASPIYDHYGTMGLDGKPYNVAAEPMSIPDPQIAPIPQQRPKVLGPPGASSAATPASPSRPNPVTEPLPAPYNPQQYFPEHAAPRMHAPYQYQQPQHPPYHDASHSTSSAMDTSSTHQNLPNPHNTHVIPPPARGYAHPNPPNYQPFQQPVGFAPVVVSPPHPYLTDSKSGAQHVSPQAPVIGPPSSSSALIGHIGGLVPSKQHHRREYPDVTKDMRSSIDACPMKPWTLNAFEPHKWLKRFEEIQSSNNDLKKEKLNAMRVHIMMDTIEACATANYQGEGGVLFRKLLWQFASQTSVSHSFEEVDERAREGSSSFRPEQPSILVVHGDTFEVGLQCQTSNLKVCVLSNGSHAHPGGAYKYGSGAQEESLFRRSNLYSRLCPLDERSAVERIAMSSGAVAGPATQTESKAKYPLNSTFSYDTVYTPNVIVFRGTEQTGYSFLDQPKTIDVLTASAIKRKQADIKMTPDEIHNMKEMIRAILLRAIVEKCDCIVLGAFGCGAFKNPPTEVAKLFHHVLVTNKYAHLFKLIVFAIVEDHNSTGNIAPFAKEFKVGVMSMLDLKEHLPTVNFH